MMTLGAVPLYVPRRISPYLIARRIARVATGASPDLQFVRDALSGRGTKQAVDCTTPAEAENSRLELVDAPGCVAA